MTSVPSVNGVTRDDALVELVRRAMYFAWADLATPLDQDQVRAWLGRRDRIDGPSVPDLVAALQRHPEPADEPVEYGLRFFFDQSITAFETRAGALEVVRHWPEHYELMQRRPAGPWVPVAPDGDEDGAAK